MSGLADRQFGRVSRRQLKWLGISEATITKWATAGYLRRVLPGVYAVGHAAPSVEGDLAAALAVRRTRRGAEPRDRGLVARPPRRQAVHDRRDHVTALPVAAAEHEHSRAFVDATGTGIWRHGLPVTTVPDTLLDCAAAGAGVNAVRRLLAQADYRRLLDPAAIEAACSNGRAGSAIIHTALERHLPRLAQTRSPLEVDFVFLCEAAGIPLPEVNVVVAGVRVDALWRAQRLVVELDGRGNHGTPAQIERDRRNELRLRGVGLLVLRYTHWQITHQSELVAPDLRAAFRRYDN